MARTGINSALQIGSVAGRYCLDLSEIFRPVLAFLLAIFTMVPLLVLRRSPVEASGHGIALNRSILIITGPLMIACGIGSAGDAGCLWDYIAALFSDNVLGLLSEYVVFYIADEIAVSLSDDIAGFLSKDITGYFPPDMASWLGINSFVLFGVNLEIRSGKFKDARVTLYGIFRNEMFFLASFFDHYRKLGVDQFIILDDQSEDGTFEFLCEQKDCVVLASEARFGDQITFFDERGEARRARAGTFLKKLIPQKFLKGKYAIYADADEFLLLPDNVRTATWLLAALEERRIPCIAASLVDFYPKHVSDLRLEVYPKSFEELLDVYSYFDGAPLLELREGAWPQRIYEGASIRLFREHGIKDVPTFLSALPECVLQHLPVPSPRAAWLKTPIIKWDPYFWLDGSHNANVPPTDKALITMVHFKFTYDSNRRIEQAMALNSHSRNGLKYFQYHRLLKEMERTGSEFLGPKTLRFSGTHDLERVGLMKWAL